MIHVVRETESTNALALQASAEGATHGEAWLADCQTAGRGRREVGGDRRAWFSPEGTGIYLSVLLRPDDPSAPVAGVTLAVGAAICATIREFTSADVWLKWPNDIFVDTRKLGGVLTEVVTSSGGLEALVVGVGINVGVGLGSIPKELSSVMTSLLIETGAACDRLSLALDLRDAIVHAWDSFQQGGLAVARPQIDLFDRSFGKRVRFTHDDAAVEGVAQGIDTDGHLLVAFDGKQISVLSGEVVFLFD